MTKARDPKAALMEWVDDQVQLDVRTKYILDKAARFANQHGRGWVLISDIAERTNSSERTVQYAMRRLEADGLIRRTGETYTVNEGSKFPRKVPFFQFAPGVAGIDPLATSGAAGSGADFAPEPGLGCNGASAGVQTVAPRNELSGTNTTSDEVGARAREAAFGKLEEAYPKRGLGFTNRPRAWAAFEVLLDRGVDPEKLTEAAAAFADDRAGKKTDQALEYWLEDGKYRGWWPEARADEPVPTAASGNPDQHAAPADDRAVWERVNGQLCASLTEAEYGSWISRAFLGAHGGQLFVVAFSSMARDWIAQRCWRRIEGWWAAADAAKRPLRLVSKLEFEALVRQAEGVG